MRIGGVFNGTGADVYLCIGFLPDFVTVWNLEGTQIIMGVWNKLHQRASEVVEGNQWAGAGSDVTALTLGNGIRQYFGGTTLGSTDVGTTTYGEGVYLKPDHFDYRRVNDTETGVVGDAATVDIDTWTLDTAASNTGHFNGDVTGTYIGEGSSINIDGQTYTITALTAGQGVSADEVTLSHSVSSGEIYAIHGMYDYKPMVSGEVTRHGFLLSNTTINVNDALIAFEAGQYSN